MATATITTTIMAIITTIIDAMLGPSEDRREGRDGARARGPRVGIAAIVVGERQRR
jgi:hypothetical protein